jgi:lysophospholipase L1-like esterase
VLRIESASENQAGPIAFGGFAARPSTKAAKLPSKTRQIEFIGDSHTVGYGNTSDKRACTPDEIWETTDASQAFGPLVAKHYDADYQVNAISGRGVVRNYNGFKGDPLPVAYPFILFDKAVKYDEPRWSPQVVVIALGTNDFSTPLNPGEPWGTRDELHADFESTYVKFLQTLRAQHPGALLVVWATDLSEGEIQAEAQKVVERFKSQDKNVAFVPVNALSMTGCDWHPSVEDDRAIAKALIDVITPIRSWQVPN